MTHTWHSTKCPILALAITGIVTASIISLIIFGSDILETPPSARMSAGTRSSAITATAPASSAIRAWGLLEGGFLREGGREWDSHLLGIDYVHDDTAFQHTCQTGLEDEFSRQSRTLDIAIDGELVIGHCGYSGCGVTSRERGSKTRGDERKDGRGKTRLYIYS